MDNDNPSSFLQYLENDPILGLKVSFTEVHSYERWVKAVGPDDFSFYQIERFSAIWALREMYIKRCGFPIITLELLDDLASMLKGKRVADIGCGTGFLTYHLRQRDVDITGFDNRIEDNHYFPNLVAQYITTVKGMIVKKDYREIDVDDYDVFIISWPDYCGPAAAEFIDRLPVGKMIVYQGEDWGGCCADDRFFEILNEDFKELDNETEALQRWGLQFDGIHDKWVVYKKKSCTLDVEQ